MRSTSLLSFVLASAAYLGAASAQPDVRDHRAPPPAPQRDHDHDHDRDDRRPPPVANGPTEAPPSPREEHQAARAGFVWIPGKWDWKGKWEWTAGHWERERAGKRWRAAQWQNQSNTWVLVDGDWIDANAPENTGIVPPPMGDHPGDHDMDHHEHHEWKLDRPTVGSFWPAKGKVGTRVVIRGRNFTPDTKVMWGPDEVRAARVSDDKIEFQVPPNATSATIILKSHGRDLIVGNYEVANYDAQAEEQRIAAERQAAAQAAWSAQQAKYAKDEAARRSAMEQHWQEMEANREQRREQRLQEIRAKWQAAFLADQDTQDELTLHAQRVAELTRAKDVATVANNQKLGVRIDVALAKENDRHEQRMSALQTAFSSRGGHP